MTGALHLVITTPMKLLVDAPEVLSLRAEDESGSFGILPAHTDFLTALPASVLSWRGGDGRMHYCALRGGMLTVRGGRRVSVACREGILGDDLAGLEADVARLRADQADAVRRARVEQMRFHASAVRQLMRALRPERAGAFDHPPSGLASPGEGGS